MALLILPRKVKLYNIRAMCEEPESLPVETAGKQWLVTPNGAALLALHCTVPENQAGSKGRWVMDVFALEQCLPEQQLFDRIASNTALPEKLALLPAKARSHSFQTLPSCTFCLLLLLPFFFPHILRAFQEH
jgi:hypothetical protein